MCGWKISVLCSVLLFSIAVGAKELRIAAWNLEHLNADGSEGCIERTEADYNLITDSINKLEYDIVALQEVKDETAARRVFSKEEWNIEMSKRPAKPADRECWGAPGRYLQHLGTGFAIRKGIQYLRHDDVEALGLEDDFQRWGTDITIIGDTNLRMISVHLASGCHGASDDTREDKADICTKLRKQIDLIAKWRDERVEQGVPFIILGDFNRRLAVDGDWAWSTLSTDESPMFLVTGDIEPKCDPRYSELIDHIAADAKALELSVEGSALEGPRVDEHPDHCAVSSIFRL